MSARMLAAVVATLLMAGCGGDGGSSEVLRLAYQHEMISLDPHGQNDSVTGSVLSAVYETLVSFSSGRTIEPCLAEQWTTPDDTRWRFRIRPDVLFHDGAPLTVDDVVSSIRRARFGPASALTTYMEVIDDVRVVPDGDRLVEVTTRVPFPLLLTRLAMLAIVPTDFDPQVPVGTGPYQWVGGHVTGPVVLQRWESYWGNRPDADRVRVTFVENDERLAQLIADGDVDVIAGSSLDFLGTGDLPPNWTTVWIPSSGTTMLGLNVHRAPLDDARVREAIDLAINRRDLVLSAFPEGSTDPASSLVPPGAFGFSPNLQPSPADPERARAMLAEVGLDPGDVVHLEHAGVSNPVVEFVVSALERVGLRVEPSAYDSEVFYRRWEQGETELFLFGWNFRWADASDFLDAVVHSRDPARRMGLLNGSGYSNPRLDGWIETAAQEPQSAPRLELMRKILTQVAVDRPYLPLFHHSRYALVRAPCTIDASRGALVQPQTVRLAGS